MNIDNPYWDAVKDAVEMDGFFNTPIVSRDFDVDGRTDYVTEYSWTITNPETVEFVAKYAGKFVIDPMAGTGYWSRLLIQMGIDVCCFDNMSWTNHVPHQHVLINKGDAPQVVRQFPHHTLFLAWPPYSSKVGFETIRNYRRNLVASQRIIYIGESESGCTGDDDMFEELDKYWEEIDSHQPVQWFGMHDCIYIYDRKANA